MKVTAKVRSILNHYNSDNPGTKANLARMLMQGKTGGTGKLVILPVDQGFEHGAARSFATVPAGYDPAYHYNMAIDSGCSAYAAPLGALEACAGDLAGSVPLILKINSANSLTRHKEDCHQAITGSVADALRLGCSAIGYTIYPGSDATYDMLNDLRAITEEAKSVGLAMVVWSYPRGGNISKDGETAIDVVAYGAHIATQMGAHIIKVKLPTDFIEQPEAKKAYIAGKVKIDTMADRVAHVMQSCYAGKRLVVFSGGATKSVAEVLDDARAIAAGGGNGSIMGRNCFQRPYDEAMKMLGDVMDIYNKAA